MQRVRGLGIETDVVGFWKSVLILIVASGFTYGTVLGGNPTTIAPVVLVGSVGSGLLGGGLYAGWKLHGDSEQARADETPRKLGFALLCVAILLALVVATPVGQTHIFLGAVGWLGAVVAGRGYYVYGPESS